MSHRRQPLDILHQPALQNVFSVDSGLFRTSSSDSTHAIFAPLHYERGYSYPLIVWLHGSESDERQLMRVMPSISMRNYVAVAPRGLALDACGETGHAKYGWRQSEEDVQEAQQRVFDAIETVEQKLHVASKRIFLAGFDDGGTMAFRVVMNHPRRFAGVLSLGGAFPSGGMPLARLSEARQLPVFIAAGRRSPAYGEAQVCADLRLLHTAGLSITLRLYPCGQELAPQMLGDVDRWIIEQITSSAQAAANVH